MFAAKEDQEWPMGKIGGVTDQPDTACDPIVEQRRRQWCAAELDEEAGAQGNEHGVGAGEACLSVVQNATTANRGETEYVTELLPATSRLPVFAPDQ